jgi:hypothetical protein
MTNLLDVTIPGVIESPIDSNAEVPTDAEYAAQCRKAVAALDGQTIILPNDVHIEVLGCNGDAFKVYQDALDRASDEVTKAIVGRCSMPIVEPFDRDKAWDELVINGNKWPPKSAP